MAEPTYRLLSELTKVEDYLDEAVFTDVTNEGETYTRYRVTRITHEVSDHPRDWTHMANVVPVRTSGIGVALLRVVNRAIEDSEVTLSPPQT
jgi:hypothetical protein